MMYMTSKSFSDSITRMAMAMAITVLMRGSEMRSRICPQPAPSRRAALIWSSGTPIRPASRIRNIIGVHCQTSAAMTANCAQKPSVNQTRVKGSPVIQPMNWFKGPVDWKRIRNM